MEASRSMSGDGRDSEAPPPLFQSYDVRNRRNVELAGLGIRTSADIFEEFRREYEAASMQRAPRTSRGDGALTEVTGRADADVGVDASADVLGRWRVGSRGTRGSLSEHFHRLDMCNQQNLARAGLRFCTSADIFQAAQRGYEEAGVERSSRRARTGRARSGPRDEVLADAAEGMADEIPAPEPSRGDPQGKRLGEGAESLAENFRRLDEANQQNAARASLGIRTSAELFQVAQSAYEEARAESSRRVRQGKRPVPSSSDQPQPKRARTVVRRERSDEERNEVLASVLRSLDEEFAEKERLSQGQAWCAPISQAMKVSTVQEFYKAFHDVRTLPIHTCMICYRKVAEAELEEIDWERWAASAIRKRDGSPFKCGRCFAIGERVPSCSDCARHLRRGALSRAAQIHCRLGCEHMFPDELKGLSPVEERLIALNSCYGFITKYSIVEGGRQSVRYPRHVKGHITVFPNNVQELVTNVLPHPLLKLMDEIHVAWQGPEKPAPSDLAALLSVRRRVVEKALVWLKRHNPLYANIEIDAVEMESWETPSHGVPSQVYARLERNEPSAWEKARTGHVVPRTERGLEDEGPVDIREVLATLGQGRDAVEEDPESADGEGGVDEAEPDSTTVPIHEISSSGMFALDAGPDIADEEKLRYACDALGQDAAWGSTRAASAQVRRGCGSEPYVHVSRGDEFADSFDPRFFAKTFPTLFPLGNGGPRQAEECIAEVAGGDDVIPDAEATARNLVSSRNMSLETWAEIVLQRHGGGFATHHVFAFLVFNMGVRSRNRGVSMVSVKRKNFPEVERIVRSLSAERLERARVELEVAGRTIDPGVNQLLRSLSLYGFRQPMSREHRLSMRRKIKSLIIRYGIPAIWFTINPNDITNPVKLRLAAYRSRNPEHAEAFLTSLDQAYKRVQLAISDPLSSAVFFHREISMFFEHYVKVGKDSVFGRISQYFGAVETNERGALHLHGLLWFQGNMRLSSILSDVGREGEGGEGQAAYQEQIIQYVDSVFTEVCVGPIVRPVRWSLV